MKFQGEIMVFSGCFWRQVAFDEPLESHTGEVFLEKLAAITKVRHKRINVQNVSISFLSCIAIV